MRRRATRCEEASTNDLMEKFTVAREAYADAALERRGLAPFPAEKEDVESGSDADIAEYAARLGVEGDAAAWLVEQSAPESEIVRSARRGPFWPMLRGVGARAPPAVLRSSCERAPPSVLRSSCERASPAVLRSSCEHERTSSRRFAPSAADKLANPNVTLVEPAWWKLVQASCRQQANLQAPGASPASKSPSDDVRFGWFSRRWTADASSLTLVKPRRALGCGRHPRPYAGERATSRRLAARRRRGEPDGPEPRRRGEPLEVALQDVPQKRRALRLRAQRRRGARGRGGEEGRAVRGRGVFVVGAVVRPCCL